MFGYFLDHVVLKKLINISKTIPSQSKFNFEISYLILSDILGVKAPLKSLLHCGAHFFGSSQIPATLPLKIIFVVNIPTSFNETPIAAMALLCGPPWVAGNTALSMFDPKSLRLSYN